MKLRVLFAGTPEIACPSLEAVARSHQVVGVLTNPDRPVGRGRKTGESPVKITARNRGLPVLQPEKLDAPFREELRRLNPEILVVAAYGKIFGPRFLELFPRGGINLHPSLLPRYRGPTPINAAILAGDRETGLTVQRLALRMDAGDILLQEVIPLTGEETAGSLSLLAAERGAPLLVRALDLIARGEEVAVPQNEDQASYCSLLNRESGRIDWNRDASYIERMVRAYDPWPGAWTGFGKESLRIVRAEPAEETAATGSLPGQWSVSEEITLGPLSGEVPASEGAVSGKGPSPGGDPPGKVLGVDRGGRILIQTGGGRLAVRELCLQSRKTMDCRSFLNGTRNFIGSVLGAAE